MKLPLQSLAVACFYLTVTRGAAMTITASSTGSTTITPAVVAASPDDNHTRTVSEQELTPNYTVIK